MIYTYIAYAVTIFTKRPEVVQIADALQLLICLRGVACWGNPDDQVSKVLNGWFALAYEEMRASDSGNLFAFCYIIMENQYL